LPNIQYCKIFQQCRLSITLRNGACFKNIQDIEKNAIFKKVFDSQLKTPDRFFNGKSLSVMSRKGLLHGAQHAMFYMRLSHLNIKG